MSDSRPSLSDLLEQRRADSLAQIDSLREEIKLAEENISDLEVQIKTIDQALSSLSRLPSRFNVKSQPLPTIKQGVIMVLEKAAPDGLTALNILERLGNELGMHYPRTSLSPQLSRLKSEGKITLKGNNMVSDLR